MAGSGLNNLPSKQDYFMYRYLARCRRLALTLAPALRSSLAMSFSTTASCDSPSSAFYQRGREGGREGGM